jgi:5-formyltetrahydrofolate cyclo-ligase
MAESIAEHKSRLRRELRARRRGLSEADRRLRSELLWDRVLDGLDGGGRFGPGTTTMAFYGFDDEPPTDRLHDAVWAAGGDLLLPRVEGSIIVAVPHRPSGPLATAVLGVPEPTGRAVDPSIIDVVIVPALAFDRHGHRLGYGAGFYDRFLPDVEPGCVVLGVCLAPLLVDELPVDDHDVTVPTVVTDEGVVRTNRSAR